MVSETKPSKLKTQVSRFVIHNLKNHAHIKKTSIMVLLIIVKINKACIARGNQLIRLSTPAYFDDASPDKEPDGRPQSGSKHVSTKLTKAV